MKKAKLWLIAALTLALGAMLFAACKPEDEPESQSVTLNYATYELDMHETVQLTAQTEGDAAVTWSSSDEGVATVDAGLVRSVAAGTATITATAGEASAECKITVINTQTAPVLTLNQSSLSVDKEGEFTVEASVTYKGKAPADDYTFTWTMADGSGDFISLTPSADKMSAVVKGVEYGEATFTVSTILWNIPLMQTVYVKVCNTSVSFEVEDYEPVEGGYKTTLALVETDEYEMTTVPAVTVLEDGKPSDLTIEWTCEGDAVSLKDGVITAEKVGSATLTGSCGGNFVRLFVDVIRPEFELSEIAIETSVAALDIELGGTVQNVSVDGGENLYESYDAQTHTLTLKKDLLPVSAADMGEGKELVITTDRATYTAPAAIYTQVINTKEELASWGTLAKAAAEGTHWDGYFVLGNDIDFEGETYEPFISYAIFVELKGDGTDSGWEDGRINGFHGVFDGKGHIIDNMVMKNVAAGGFVGLLHQDGVIRNVAFTNAVHLGLCGFICTVGNGRIENVYVSCLEQGGGTNPDYSGFFYSQGGMAAARVVHCFAEIRSIASGANFTYSIGRAHEGYGILDGVYTVGNPNGVSVITDGGGTRNIYGAYADYAGLRAANIDFSDWDTDFWKIVNGIPFPKNLEVPEVAAELTVAPSKNGTVAAGKTEYQYADPVMLAITPAEGYKLFSITVNGEDMTSLVKDNVLSFGCLYGVEEFDVQASFVEALDAYDVTFKTDAKWGADGLVVTLTRGGVTKTVTLGDNAVVEDMEPGEWTATTVINGLTVSLGTFNIQWSEYFIDFDTLFKDTGVIIDADIATGGFTYATGNAGSMTMDVALEAGDAAFILAIKFDAETVAAGKDWNCIGLSFVIGGTTYQACLMYSSMPGVGDYQNCYFYWANYSGWLNTHYLKTEFAQALTRGEEVYLGFVYRAATGGMEVYCGVTPDTMTKAQVNTAGEVYDMALGSLPKNATVTQVGIVDTWGGVKSTIETRISYGKTLEDAVGAIKGGTEGGEGTEGGTGEGSDVVEGEGGETQP